jgi:hypothetical protein
MTGCLQMQTIVWLQTQKIESVGMTALASREGLHPKQGRLEG